MRNLFALTTVSLLLASCANPNPTPQIVEVTRIIEVTRVVTPQMPPATNAASMLFPAECLAPQPGIDYSLYKIYGIDMIGYCSFIEPSPDGRYLAYSTMTCISGTDPALCGEVVKVLEVNLQEAKVVHFIGEGEKKLVSGLEWNLTGDLVIIRTEINSPVDTLVISWPPPSKK